VVGEAGLTLVDARALELSDYDLDALKKMRPDSHRCKAFFSKRKSKFADRAALRQAEEKFDG